MKCFSRIIFLLLLTVLISAPPVLAGYHYRDIALHAPQDEEASRYYEMAAKLLFWEPNWYEEAGLRENHDPQRAMRLLVAARQQDSLSPAGQIALGDAWFNSGNTQEALAEWEYLLTHHLEVPAASARLINIYHANQQYTDEQQVLSQWLEVEPGNAAASERMGLLLSAAAAPQALVLLETAAAASPQNAARLKQLISSLKTPAQDVAYRLTLCGQALANLNEWPLASQAFSLAVQHNPGYASAWAWLGLSRQKTNAPNALEALQYANVLEGDSASLHAMLGTYWQVDKNLQKAEVEFQKATEIEPDNPAWWLALAGVEAQVNLPAALISYTKAINLEPQKASNWYALATFCVENNAFLDEYGLQAALRAYALEPQNPLYMDMLGQAQMAEGQSASAEIMFKKAVNAVPVSQAASFHLHLGLLYLETRREAQARDEFQQALKADPQGIYGAQAKKLLERYFP